MLLICTFIIYDKNVHRFVFLRQSYAHAGHITWCDGPELARGPWFWHIIPRVWRKGGEAHSPSCLKSSVKFPQSVMIWGAMSSAGLGPLCFLKTNITTPFTKKFWSTSCFLLLTSFLKMLISFSSRIWHLSTKSWLKSWCAWLVSKLTRPEHYGVLSRGKWETRDQKCRWAEGHCQRNLGFHTTSAVPQTDHLHAVPNWGSN